MSKFDRFTTGSLLVAAWASIDPKRHWSMSNHHFALAVDTLKRSNSVARLFYTTDGAGGRWCGEFEEALSCMMAAGLIYYISPEYSHLRVTVLPSGDRAIQAILARIQATPEQLAQAIELANLHWTLASQQV